MWPRDPELWSSKTEQKKKTAPLRYIVFWIKNHDSRSHCLCVFCFFLQFNSTTAFVCSPQFSWFFHEPPRGWDLFFFLIFSYLFRYKSKQLKVLTAHMGWTLLPKSTDVQPRPTVSESAMMESLHVAVAVLSLLSLGQTAPTTNCESLTQQIQMPGRDQVRSSEGLQVFLYLQGWCKQPRIHVSHHVSQLLGRWNYIAESTDMRGSKELLEMSRGTVWLNYVAATEENIMIGSMHLKT